VYGRARAREGPAGPEQAWKSRITALIESNPRLATESSPRALFQAVTYPDIITTAAESLFGSP